MNIEQIKNKVKQLQNNRLKIKVSLGRNKYEYLEGHIINIHPNIFVVRTQNGMRTFSYSDVAIKTVILTKFN